MFVYTARVLSICFGCFITTVYLHIRGASDNDNMYSIVSTGKSQTRRRKCFFKSINNKLVNVFTTSKMAECYICCDKVKEIVILCNCKELYAHVECVEKYSRLYKRGYCQVCKYPYKTRYRIPCLGTDVTHIHTYFTYGKFRKFVHNIIERNWDSDLYVNYFAVSMFTATAITIINCICWILVADYNYAFNVAVALCLFPLSIYTLYMLGALIAYRVCQNILYIIETVCTVSFLPINHKHVDGDTSLKV